MKWMWSVSLLGEVWWVWSLGKEYVWTFHQQGQKSHFPRRKETGWFWLPLLVDPQLHLMWHNYHATVSLMPKFWLRVVGEGNLPVLACLSDPAKSTRLSFPFRICSSPVIISMLMVKMEWERELSAFISVAPTERFFHPRSTKFSHSVTLWTACWDRSEKIKIKIWGKLFAQQSFFFFF